MHSSRNPRPPRQVEYHGVDWVIGQIRHLELNPPVDERIAYNVASWLRDHRHKLIAPLLMATNGNKLNAALVLEIKPLGFVSYENGIYVLTPTARAVIGVLRKQLEARD